MKFFEWIFKVGKCPIVFDSARSVFNSHIDSQRCYCGAFMENLTEIWYGVTDGRDNAKGSSIIQRVNSVHLK